ncbi:hypothetical protein H5410_026095 [Solanum commersonii]|uniref:Uncharacterized protein n=1 Tax=Solanum commersonii TaxID=4109 RepID=A0A9J5YV38_SOLCO|nr:hypothetical protein H5410_026095 [Solanum commersonii]
MKIWQIMRSELQYNLQIGTQDHLIDSYPKDGAWPQLGGFSARSEFQRKAITYCNVDEKNGIVVMIRLNWHPSTCVATAMD